MAAGAAELAHRGATLATHSECKTQRINRAKFQAAAPKVAMMVMTNNGGKSENRQ